jgi:hypothetical protein
MLRKNKPKKFKLMTATGIPSDKAPVIDVSLTTALMLRKSLEFFFADLKKNKPINTAALQVTILSLAKYLDEQIYIMMNLLQTEDTKPVPAIFDLNYADLQKAVRAKNTAKKSLQKKRK